MNDKLKKIIFDKLYQDLKNVEIIPYNDSIWFINRENTYWYFEYIKSGTLRWRYIFFNPFFHLFSLEKDDYQPIIAEWVEEVLNCKINTTSDGPGVGNAGVEEVLNCKINTTLHRYNRCQVQVEEALNCKVNTTIQSSSFFLPKVEEVLNYKVNTTVIPEFVFVETLEAVLNQNK